MEFGDVEFAEMFWIWREVSHHDEPGLITFDGE